MTKKLRKGCVFYDQARTQREQGITKNQAKGIFFRLMSYAVGVVNIQHHVFRVKHWSPGLEQALIAEYY